MRVIEGRGRKLANGPKVGLALAGGGPAGAIYEIGALRALEEAIEGVDLNDLFIYVGVSAGAFVAACLANGITTTELCRTIASDESDEGPFAPGNFLAPRWREMAWRALRVPGLFLGGLWDYLGQPRNYSVFEPLLRTSRALPVGIFDSHRIGEYLADVFARPGRTDDFQRLGRRLVLVATDLDTGRAVLFGEPDHDDVPISKAVQASAALPGFFAPVVIDGRHYVDGVLKKTVHASVAMKAGAELLLAVNPIVPVDTSRAVEEGVMRRGKLVDRGLVTVMSQTLRTIIRSRMTAGFAKYSSQYPDVDSIVIEPRRDDYKMFFTNIFSFAERRAVCAHGYRETRQDLWSRRELLEPIFARRGLRLRTELLEDSERQVWECLAEEPEPEVARDKPRLELVDRLDGALDRLESVLTDRAGAA